MKLNTHTLGSVLTCAILLLSTPLANAQPQFSVDLTQGQHLLLADAGLPWVQGKVVKISTKRGVVTIAHGEISHLSMPSMTMGFKTDDQAVLEQLSAGDVIEFQTEERDGKLILLEVRQPNS